MKKKKTNIKKDDKYRNKNQSKTLSRFLLKSIPEKKKKKKEIELIKKYQSRATSHINLV